MVEQQKSYEHVLTYLEDALRDGKLTLGQSLPPERELAEQLGISRQFRAGGRPPAGAHGLSGEQPGGGQFHQLQHPAQFAGFL